MIYLKCRKCKFATVALVILSLSCLVIFFKAVYIPSPTTMDVRMKAYFNQGVLNSYYPGKGSEIYSVWKVCYYLHDDMLHIEIHGDVTLPTEQQYLNKGGNDKIVCEVHIEPWGQNEMVMPELTEESGFVQLYFDDSPVTRKYKLKISEDRRFYEAEYPIDSVVLLKPQNILIVMEFNVGKIKRSFDINVNTQMAEVAQKAEEEYKVELVLPSEYEWKYYAGARSKEIPPQSSDGIRRCMAFENQGDGTVNAGAERSLRYNWAVILSVLMWFFGFFASGFYRFCFSTEVEKEALISKKQTLNVDINLRK